MAGYVSKTVWRQSFNSPCIRWTSDLFQSFHWNEQAFGIVFCFFLFGWFVVPFSSSQFSLIILIDVEFPFVNIIRKLESVLNVNSIAKTETYSVISISISKCYFVDWQTHSFNRTKHDGQYIFFFFLTWQFGWATRLLAAVSSKIANAIIETSMKKKSLFHRIILIYIAAWNWYGQSDQIFRNIHEIGIFCHHNDNDSPLASRHQSFQYIKSIFFLVLFHFDDFLTLWQRFFFSIKYKYKWKQNSTKQNNIVLFSCSTIFESCMINVERETGMRNKQKMTKN